VECTGNLTESLLRREEERGHVQKVHQIGKKRLQVVGKGLVGKDDNGTARKRGVRGEGRGGVLGATSARQFSQSPCDERSRHAKRDFSTDCIC